MDIDQLKAVNENTEKEYQQPKVFSDQIDCQFSVGKSFSFFLFTTENINEGALPKNKKYEYYKAVITGAERRFWWGRYLLEYIEDNIFSHGLNL